MISAFNIAAIPSLYFGTGKISALPGVIKNYGTRILLVTGAKSFADAAHGQRLLDLLKNQFNDFHQYTIPQEPSPAIIDKAVEIYGETNIDVVVAIGGGSVLDAGKAISAMLPLKEPVKNYLEGVGTKNHPGKKIPFIAVPTTAGTGSEATKNAVLSETGDHGYKKSLRHNNFVPDVAIVDPELMLSCPKTTTAASGMDAFTQLLESYLSTTANPFTDALAFEGLSAISRSLTKVYHDGTNLEARTDVALAAYLSGITLANAGLGLVHGFASAIGGYFDIPHGVVCSALMPGANRITVRQLRSQGVNEIALRKYSAAGKLFSGLENKSPEYYVDFLLGLINEWTVEMKIPSLGQYDITPKDFERIIKASDNKNNPVAIDADGMREILALSS
jgi:alcohol dehydrogenase class IV